MSEEIIAMLEEVVLCLVVLMQQYKIRIGLSFHF